MAVESQTPDTVATDAAPSGELDAAGTKQVQQAANETAGTQSPADQPLLEPQFAQRPVQGTQELQGDDNLLFGPTERAQEHPAFGAVNGRPSVPPQAGAWLSSLRVAAMDPDAPPRVKQLMQLVNGIFSGQVK